MDQKLTELYEKMIRPNATLKESEMTVGTGATKKGGDLEGKEKAKPIKTNKPEGLKETPIEDKAHSHTNDEVEKGKGKPLAKKESADIKVGSAFMELFQKTLKEDLDTIADGSDDSVQPSPDIESQNFNEEEGDFESEVPEDEEEVDVATALRGIAEELSRIADKIIGVDSDEDLGDLGDLEGGDVSPEGELPDETPEQVKKESADPHKLKPAKKSSLGPKMPLKIKSKISTTGASKSKSASNGKDFTGKLSPASKTTLGPNNSMTVSGNGSTVKGKNTTFFG